MRSRPSRLAYYKVNYTLAKIMRLIKIFVFIVGCLLSLAPRPAPAQGRPTAGRLSQLDNAKIAFLTSRLTLTQDQAQRFWPLYNEFANRRRDLNRAARDLRREATNAGLSDAQLRDNLNQDFGIRQKQLDLERDYFNQAQKVLTLRQVVQLSQAERDFTREVLQRVANNGPGSSPGEAVK